MAVLDPDQEHFRCDGMTVVRLEGEIDIATAESVFAGLASAVVENCTVVDLSAVEFIDASGVNALVGALRIASGSQRHLLLASPPRQLRRILDVLDLHGVLPTHDDAAAACASHAGHAVH
ncbi:STAS domain-containing protein [Nocardiopsis ganjiahuensis]|uniref:STAS domain-containing protein n=1 Tax=Nocardiopsis ganjiahuensis TaxID=239984 RepID=UPI00034AC12B|nr:STAS domain-containing protein [Nocardiopsis ganjiahuensis]